MSVSEGWHEGCAVLVEDEDGFSLGYALEFVHAGCCLLSVARVFLVVQFCVERE